MHTYKHTNIHTYIHTNIHPPTGGRAQTYHTYVHACMHACTPTYRHPPTHQGAGATELVTYNPPPTHRGGGGKSYHMKPGNPCPLGGEGGGLAGLDHIYILYIYIHLGFFARTIYIMQLYPYIPYIEAVLLYITRLYAYIDNIWDKHILYLY